jgi:hypothetical protein
VVGAATLGACLALGSIAPLRSPRTLPPALLGVAAGAGAVLWCWSRARATGEPLVTQGVGEFLWSVDRLAQTLTLPVAAWAMALPISAALLFPIAPLASRDAMARAETVAPRAVAWTIFIALGIYLTIGVSNPRYTMPALALVPMLVPYVLIGRGRFGPLRAHIATLCTLGSPGAYAGLLLVGAGAHIAVESHRYRDERDPAYTGRPVGRSLASAMLRATPDPAGAPPAILADHAIEARPEVLWYTRTALEQAGIPARVRWVPGLALRPLSELDPGVTLLLRDDPGSLETVGYTEEANAGSVRERWRGHVHEFELVALTFEQDLDRTNVPTPGPE